MLERGPLHAGGRHADSDRRARAGRRARRSTSGSRRRSAPASTQANPQLKNGNGYDHNWVLNRTGAGPAARGACRRAHDRPHARSRDHRARRAVLYRQFPRRHSQGQGRDASTPSAAASASRRSTSLTRRITRRFPTTILQAGADVLVADRVHVRHSEGSWNLNDTAGESCWWRCLPPRRWCCRSGRRIQSSRFAWMHAASAGAMTPVWAFFGYDEPNYTYMKDGRKLLVGAGGAQPRSGLRARPTTC